MGRILVAIILSFGVFGCGHEESTSDLSLIGGREAQLGEFPEVVRIITGNSACTATIIGPRVILTAAHCANTGATSRFRIGNQTFQARMTRAPGFPRIDHDIALGVIAVNLPVVGASIGGSPRRGNEITLAGFGCIQPGGGGGNDGILRVGNARINDFSGFDFVSRGGAALCFGDSGGPAFIPGTKQVVGVNSKGDIRTTNFNTRTDLQRSRNFFRQFSRANNVTINGI